MNIRIGNGVDAHAFADGRALTIGGVVVAHDRGLAGHSDADVLLHAVADAILGALALGDLGAHFPATAQWKDADSRALLRHVFALATARSYAIGNVDATVVAQAPKLAPYIDVMREHRGRPRLRHRAGLRQGDHDRPARLHRPRRRHRQHRDGAAGRCTLTSTHRPQHRGLRYRKISDVGGIARS